MQQQSQQHPGMYSSKCIQTEMTVGDIRSLESHSSHEMESRESKIEELQQVGGQFETLTLSFQIAL